MADDPTYDFTPRIAERSYDHYDKTRSLDVSGDLSNSRFSLANRIETGTGLGEDFLEATRTLLRQRLLFASRTLAGLIFLALLLSHLFDQPTLQQTLLRVISFGFTLLFVMLLQ